MAGQTSKKLLGLGRNGLEWGGAEQDESELGGKVWALVVIIKSGTVYGCMWGIEDQECVVWECV